MKTQTQMFYDAQARLDRQNETFLFLVKEGLTAEELRKLIAKRPEVYSQFSNWLERLSA